MTTPAADPYSDSDVTDVRGHRFSSSLVAISCLVALLTGWWIIFPLVAIQFVIGLTLPRKYCVTCLLFYEVVQPRVGEGDLEDSRLPRFANKMGLIFLTGATIAHVLGYSTLGWILGGTVAVLAGVSATTGFCFGCKTYRIFGRTRTPKTIDLQDAGVTSTAGQQWVVQFSHPLCTDCRDLEKKLTQSGESTAVIDVTQTPEIARKYKINSVPTAFLVSPEGVVLERIA